MNSNSDLKWSFLQKAFLVMTFLMGLVIVAGGLWFRNVLEHTQFKVLGQRNANESPELHNSQSSSTSSKFKGIHVPTSSLSQIDASPIPPPKVIYDQAQKAFEKNDNPEAYRLLDLLIKTYPNSPITAIAQKSREVVIQAMLLKASGGIDPSQMNHSWQYLSKDNNFFAVMDNTVTPQADPTLQALKGLSNTHELIINQKMSLILQI